MNLAAITIGVLFVSPLFWRFGITQDRDDDTLMWSLYSGPLFITLGIETRERSMYRGGM